jgi:hypothetical protein
MGRPGWREAHHRMEVHGEIDKLEPDIFTDGLNQQVYEIGNFISPRVASSRATKGAKPSTPASTSPPSLYSPSSPEMAVKIIHHR